MNDQKIIICQIRPLNQNNSRLFQCDLNLSSSRNMVISSKLFHPSTADSKSQFWIFSRIRDTIGISLWNFVRPKKIIAFIRPVLTIILDPWISSQFINSQMWLLERHDPLFCRLYWEQLPGSHDSTIFSINIIWFLRLDDVDSGDPHNHLVPQNLIMLHQNRNETPSKQ
jgi:hypothetical protein